MARPHVPPTLPFSRADPLQVAAELHDLQERCPVAQVITPAGDPAWLVTRHQDVRALFADQRLGRSHPEPERAARVTTALAMAGPAGDHESENAEHQRLRTLLAPAFAPRRLAHLRDRLQQAVNRLLDDLVASPQPADLHLALNAQLPVIATCELLGIPQSEHARCVELSMATTDLFDSAATHRCGPASHALNQLGGHVYELISQHRTEPGPGLIDDLLTAGLDADDILGLGTVLFAGHDITVARLDYGAVLLMQHQGALAAATRQPELWAGAVEEVLRMSAPVDHGLPRYAHADVQIGDVTIQAGDAVLLSGSVANRDPAVFAAPDRFDVERRPNPHVSFGHGAGFCLGASLARMELEIAFRSLFERLPDVQLAVPLKEIPLRTTHLLGGIATLPVRW